MGENDHKNGSNPPEVGRIVQPDLPATVDWLMVIGVGLLGLISIGGGVALVAAGTPGVVQGLIDAGTVRGKFIPPDATVPVLVETVRWGGIALLLTGASLLFAAVWYAVHRRQERHRTAGNGRHRGLRSNAFVGAVVTLLVSFVPFSQVLGGIVAGYLHTGSRRDTVLAGTVSGALAALPVLVTLVGFLGGFAVALSNVGADAPSSIVVIVAVGSVIFGVLVNAIFGGIGELIGGEAAPDAPTTPE